VRGLILLAAAALAPGCDLESLQDKAYRGQLAGAWSHVESASERTVTFRVDLAADGTFTFKIDSPERTETRAGRWYVTEGQYKLKFEVIDGKPLSSSRIVYSTRRLLQVEAAEFSCSDDINEVVYTWTRVSSA
jgi:hypothetical protein